MAQDLYKILELAERSSAQARELGQRLVLFAKGTGNLDKTGNLHVLFGRSDFKEEAMLENLKAIQVWYRVGKGLR